MEKKAISMSFNWMFALLAGGVILFLAIYATTKFIETGEEVVYTETAAQLIALLDPLETGLASGRADEINFKKPSRIYLKCNSLNNRPFGKQTLAFSEQTFGEEFGEKGQELDIKNKYVFAENVVEGKSMSIFSKPIFMGFKIGDSIIINSEEYCFYKAPNEIQDEIEGLGIKNIQFSNDLNNCSGIKVCFVGSGCDIDVLSNKVIKDGQELYYTEDLIYSAIFSSSENYECNIKRLRNRFNELSLVYIDKIKIIENKGCSSNIEGNLRNLMVSAKALKSSKDLAGLKQQADVIDAMNLNAGNCRLW
jgi:hypothetical protein